MDSNNDFLGLAGKVVLITGASSGLGARVAEALARHGASLALTGRNQQGLDRTVRDCTSHGLPASRLVVVAGDVTEDEHCRGLIDRTVEHFGRIDVLINNAGIVKTGTFQQCTAESLDEVFSVNVRAMVVVTRHALPFIKASRGCIVNISSFTGLRPVNDYLAYCLSKAAVEQFTKNLALELGQIGVRVNSVCPGIMRDTNFWLRPGLLLNKYPLLGGLVLKKVSGMYPLQRPCLSGEVVPAILFLSSDKCASFITGSSLLVDGGKALTSEQAEQLM